MPTETANGQEKVSLDTIRQTILDLAEGAKRLPTSADYEKYLTNAYSKLEHMREVIGSYADELDTAVEAIGACKQG
jgi:hypothetical protein